MKTKSSDKNRLIELDCARNLAAIDILAYHFVVESNTAGYIYVSPWMLQMFSFLASVGINLFFLLSGAGLTYRWQNRWDLKEYSKGRILSIYPDFWAAFFSLFVYGEVLHGNNASVPKWKILYSIIGIDGYMAQFTSTFYKIGEWFLGCLLLLYALFPVFRHFVFPDPKTFFFGSILFLFWLVWPSLCLPYDGDHMVLGQAFVFWVGMLLSHCIGRRYSLKWLIPCGVACGAFILFHIHAKYTAFLCAVFIILLACALAESLKRLPYAARFFICFFSKQSYRMFLIHHVLLVLVMIPAAIRHSWHPLLAFAIYFVSCTILSILLGYLSKPLVLLLRLIGNRGCSENDQY